jgi:hypothetical protein
MVTIMSRGDQILQRQIDTLDDDLGRRVAKRSRIDVSSPETTVVTIRLARTSEQIDDLRHDLAILGGDFLCSRPVRRAGAIQGLPAPESDSL